MIFIVASMRFDTLHTRCVGHGVPAHARLVRACAHLLHQFAQSIAVRTRLPRCGIFANICLLPSLLAAAFDVYLALIVE